MVVFFIVAGILLYLFLSHLLSYSLLKKRILTRQRWGINVCCGRTDGGGVNADIVKHKDVSNFVLIKDVCNLPFRDQQFETVLSSHTIEHVDNPVKFYQELRRIGKRVSIVLPPLWDITAALNVFEHKFIFLTFKKEHTRLPLYIKLPLASFVHKNFGQRIKA